MKLPFLLTFTAILLFNLAVFAQENIDVRSIEVLRSLGGSSVSFEMQAFDSNGQIITYREADAFMGRHVEYESCRPCRAPLLFDTNPFADQFIIEVDSTNIYIKFYLTSAYFSPIYLNQRDMIQRRSFFKHGVGSLRGRLEVIDGDVPGIVAVDNDFELKGAYFVNFTRAYFALPESRYVDQTGATYFLSQTGKQETNN